jgi:hypothetical protein
MGFIPFVPTGGNVPLPIPIVDGGTGQITQQAGINALALVGSSGTFLRSNGVNDSMTAIQPGDIPTGAENYDGVFGDGTDSSATLDGVATVAWASLAGSTYTMSRDCNCTNLTVNNAITLAPNGYRILCRGTFTNNGTVSSVGAAGNANGNAGGAGGSGTLGAGKAAGAGTTTTGTGGTNTGCAGYGSGGAGGTGSGGAGGAGGTAGSASNKFFANPFPVLAGVVSVFGSAAGVGGGPSGGGGGGDTVNKGGGGGAGGSAIAIMAWAAINNSVITVAGGPGGTPVSGNCGGGGGGSGGIILVYSLAAWTAGTTTVTGGALGSGVGTGTNGTAGGTGSVLNVVIV